MLLSASTFLKKVHEKLQHKGEFECLIKLNQAVKSFSGCFLIVLYFQYVIY